MFLPGLLVAALLTPAESLPAWWTALLKDPGLSASFTQASESEVFGTLKRTGHVLLGKDGRLRVQYEDGLLYVADGQVFISHDPDTRTAQKILLRNAVSEVPLLGVLADPGRLERHFSVRSDTEGGMTLTSKEPGVPKLVLRGQGGFLHTVTWVDATGAKQVLTLQKPRRVKPAAASFRFDPPKGTQWINSR